MKKQKTLPVFTAEQCERVHRLLALRVAHMMGRKFEEGDWADVYCEAKGIPKKGWSNLNIDVMYDLLGVEHKMLCYRSRPDIREACGTSLMHPAATRAVRLPPGVTEPNAVMADIFRQYGELIEKRRSKVREESGKAGGVVDLRYGWLLWQENLHQFMYFEEEMSAPDPARFRAQWNESAEGGRRRSKSLWVYEKESDKKRYSVTTDAGIKIQPYFDVPAVDDANLYHFTVIGEVVSDGRVRVWVSENTYENLVQLLGEVSTQVLDRTVLEVLGQLPKPLPVRNTKTETGHALFLSEPTYRAFVSAVSGVNDDHRFQFIVRFLKESRNARSDG